MIYIFVLFLILCGIYKDARYAKSTGSNLFWFICLIMVLISSLAYHIGTDSYTYEIDYYNFKPLNQIDYKYLYKWDRYQPGWVFFQSFCRMLGFSYYGMKFLFALFVNITVFSFIIKRSSRKYLCLLFYFIISYLYFNFEIYRQAVAISFFLIALSYFDKNKWLKYVFCILLAYEFHSSAIILLIVPLLNFQLDRKFITLTFVSLSILILLSPILTSLFATILDISFISASSGKELLEYYSQSDQFGKSYLSITKWKDYLINVFLPIWLIYNLNKRNLFLPYQGLVAFSAFLFVVGEIIPILFRVNQYLILVNLLFYSESLLLISKVYFKKYSKQISFSFCALYLIYSSLGYFQKMGLNEYYSYIRYYPYSSIFDKTINKERESIYRTFNFN